VLSRLISLLRRIPAVKWAFTRLRPLPRSGRIDAAPIAADEEHAVVVDIADAAPALDSSSSPLHDDADVAAPAAERDPDVCVIAETPTAAPSDISASDDLSEEAPTETATAAIEETSVCSVDAESGPVEVSDFVVGNEPSPDECAEVAPAVAGQLFITPADMETAPVEASYPVIDDEPASSVSAEIEPVAVDETLAIVADTEISAPVVVEASLDSDPAPGVAAEIAPEPAPVSPAPKSPAAPRARAKVTEPVDRAALIRQRWTETGIRMWNPRLHGTGDATLNIQGRVGLLPPEPGETMPRYDKLEFRMLGGQIVCEGVIVEPPAHAGQRSFTRLAEPRHADRTREPVRERQAALA
jgi:hypothetical protein